MPAKAPFSKAQYETLRAAAQRARKKFKNQEEIALAIGITQPSFSALLAGKWKPGVTTAKAIANLSGQTLEELIGEYGSAEGDEMKTERNPYPNLDVCVRFYASTKHWAPWTIAAARAGFFGGDDFAPPTWQEKLDQLETSLAKARALVAKG